MKYIKGDYEDKRKIISLMDIKILSLIEVSIELFLWLR